MMLRISVAVVLLLCVSGCFRNVYTIGEGARGGEVRVHVSWYALWGFVPLSRVDTRRLVGAADSYEITTSFGVKDVLLDMLTGPFGFYRQTTVVRK